MKISVLIASYHAAPTIGRALASVLTQSHQTWELIVVEDGSHDGTEQLVEAFALGCKNPVHYENLGVNQGVATARNRLLALATGDAVAFLDADDWWSLDHLENLAAALTAGADLVVAGVQVFDLANDEERASVLPPDALTTDPVATLFKESVIITSSSVALSRETVRRTGDFDSRFRVGEDRDYWLRAALTGATVRIASAITCHYAKHAGSTMARTLLVASENVRFYEKHRALTAVPASKRDTHLAAALVIEARLLRATDDSASLELLLRAWRLRPLSSPPLAQLAFSFWRRLTTSRTPRTLLVADRLGGQCGRSGIHQLARFLRDWRGVRVLDTPDTRPRRWVGKVWSLLRRGPIRNQSQSFTELETGWNLTTSSFATVHFLVGENHRPYLSLPANEHPVIATLHMPASEHRAPPPRTGRVHTLVLLTAHDLTFFSGAWGARRTVVIPHGVDTTFFHPGNNAHSSTPSILVVGRFLRDFTLTAETVARLAARNPSWHFDFVVPAEVWHGPELAVARALPGARWHDRIDDEALRRLYQEATCHLTPFRDCTANNALVESLACGLPVVTTDRGGVRDYGAGTVYPLSRDNSAAALVELCERYVAEPVWRARVATGCRAFALRTLAWPVVAQRYLTLYAQVARAS